MVSKFNMTYSKNNISISNAIMACVYFLVAFFICVILPNEYSITGLYYCCTILLAVFFAGLAQNSKKKVSYNIFMSISLLVLFFTLGFRNFSGIDDDSYIKIFYDVNSQGVLKQFAITGMEPGYLLLNRIVGLFTDNYFYMQLLTSLIPLILFYRAFNNKREIINMTMAVFLLSTLIYFQVLSVAVIRIFIAMGIVINAYDYLEKKSYKKYTALILIASTFHYSSLFMIILVYFAINRVNLIKNRKKFIIYVLILTPIIFIIISKYLVPIMGVRYVSYGNINKLQIDISNFDILPILILLIINCKYINKEKKLEFKLLIVIYTLSIIMSIYSSMVSVGRLIFYTNSALFIAAPMVSRALKGKTNGIIFDVIIIVYGFIYVYYTQFMLESHIPNLFPYQNILFRI